jgi:hypothetical protein
METLAEDLLLLAVRPNGKLGAAPKLRFGLSGSELVRLAAVRRIDIVRGRIVVLDAAPTGDDLLDAALQSMAGGRREPTAKAWVARSRPGLVDRYLDRLAAAGVIRAAMNASVQAATDAAVAASIDAATQAAISASADAAAHHGGAAGGHH